MRAKAIEGSCESIESALAIFESETWLGRDVQVSILDRIAGFAIRQERAINILGIAWFALSCAITARFIAVPDWIDIPYVTDRNAWALSGAWNALWWGFAKPAIDKRREALIAQSSDEQTLID